MRGKERKGKERKGEEKRREEKRREEEREREREKKIPRALFLPTQAVAVSAPETTAEWQTSPFHTATAAVLGQTSPSLATTASAFLPERVVGQTSPSHTATAAVPNTSPTRTATAVLGQTSPSHTATAAVPNTSPTRTATAVLGQTSPSRTATAGAFLQEERFVVPSEFRATSLSVPQVRACDAAP